MSTVLSISQQIFQIVFKAEDRTTVLNVHWQGVPLSCGSHSLKFVQGSNQSSNSFHYQMIQFFKKNKKLGCTISDFLTIFHYFTNHLADNRCQYRYEYFLPTPNCRDHQVSSVVEFTYSIIMRTFTMLAGRAFSQGNSSPLF